LLAEKKRLIGGVCCRYAAVMYTEEGRVMKEMLWRETLQEFGRVAGFQVDNLF
jgi:hypothetical protein